MDATYRERSLLKLWNGVRGCDSCDGRPGTWKLGRTRLGWCLDAFGEKSESAEKKRRLANTQSHEADLCCHLGCGGGGQKRTRPRGYKRILAWILKGMANISIIEEAIIPGANQQYLDAAFWEERYAAEGELKKSTREWLGDYSIFAEHFRRHVSDKGASILILGQ